MVPVGRPTNNTLQPDQDFEDMDCFFASVATRDMAQSVSASTYFFVELANLLCPQAGTEAEEEAHLPLVSQEASFCTALAWESHWIVRFPQPWSLGWEPVRKYVQRKILSCARSLLAVQVRQCGNVPPTGRT